jgi:glycine/D-amino acid oxidase-like deaminating enzyme
VGAEVLLITEGELTNQASGRSLAWLNSAGMRSRDYHLLRTASIDRYRTLAAQHPEAAWLRFDGGLRWGVAGEDVELYRQHEHEVAHGYDSQLLTIEQVTQEVPGVDPSAVPETGAVWNLGEGWVHLPSLASLLISWSKARGGRVVTGAGRVVVETNRHGVVGVRSERGDRFGADVVLLATGHTVPAMAAELGVTIPDATVLALLVTTEPVEHSLRVVLNTPRVAFRPEPGAAWRSTRTGPRPV